MSTGLLLGFSRNEGGLIQPQTNDPACRYHQCRMEHEKNRRNNQQGILIVAMERVLSIARAPAEDRGETPPESEYHNKGPASDGMPAVGEVPGGETQKQTEARRVEKK